MTFVGNPNKVKIILSDVFNNMKNKNRFWNANFRRNVQQANIIVY